MTQLNRVSVTCKQLFQLDTDAVDVVGALLPVTVGDDKVIFADQIVSKCMYIDTLDHRYVAMFPCSCVVLD